MGHKATAAVVHESGGEFALESVELEDPRHDEILVRIEASGMCHADVIGKHMVPTPSVLGHEGTGIVEQVGGAVHDTRPGDRVVISYAWCSTCPNCLDDRRFHCEKHGQMAFGGRRLDGSSPIRLGGREVSSYFQQSSFASHAITLERDVVRVDSPLPSELLAALPCGVIAGAGAVLNSFNARPGDSLMVFGAGAVGMSAVMAANLIGLSPIVAVDIHKERLDLALEVGATHAFNARDGEVVRRLREIAPHGVRYALDTSNQEQSWLDASECVANGGEFGIVNVPDPVDEFAYKPSLIFFKGISLRAVIMGSANPATFLPQLLKWHAAGRFPFERMVKTYDFADINQACADSLSGKAIKPVLKMT